jgi:hypothetical protein
MKSILALLLLGGFTSAPAQSFSIDDITDFAARARESTARYQDQQEALKAGYRRIGPDFPSMGEHWLNRAIVMRGVIDPLRPPILEYITVKGRPVLAGVAYAQLAYDQAPTSEIPAPSLAWHYHAGSVDEESFIASHAEGGASDSTHGPRIAVLHAWLWAENPAGLFATDNWMLPWLRLEAQPPVKSPVPDSLTMMAALAAGGEAYFTTLLRLRHGLGAETIKQVAAVLRKHADRVRSGERTASRLGAGWRMLEGELRAICEACSLMVHSH